MTNYHLAQLNIVKLVAPIDSLELAEFVANIGRINGLADEAPGFIWRLQTEEGDATGIDFFGHDHIVNMSLWDSIEALHSYVYRTAHVEIMARKKEWFHKMNESHMVLWRVPEGHIPSIEEASQKLMIYRENGPTHDAFAFKSAFCRPHQ